MSGQEFVCLECGKRCGNAGALKNHQKSHKKPTVQSPSLLRFLKKRAPPKKMAVELRPISRKPKQIRLSMRSRSLAAPAVPVIDVPGASVKVTYPKLPKVPRPPRRPRKSNKKYSSDMSPFLAPEGLTSPSLNKKFPEFRVAHVRYYNSLKENFPMLDKKMYHQVNAKSIGVKLRAFQIWFDQYENNLKKIKAKANPKPKPERRQKKRT